MARLSLSTFLALLACIASTSHASHASSSISSRPWGIPRGGESSYAGQLEAVKTSVLEAASDAVRFSNLTASSSGDIFVLVHLEKLTSRSLFLQSTHVCPTLTIRCRRLKI